MRKNLMKAVAYSLIGTGAALAAMGFPKRVGLTSARALVSMPGDLVLPTANLQADRAGTLNASPEDVWPLVDVLASKYADFWDVPLEVVYQERFELLVLQTADAVIDEVHDQEYWTASLAIRLVPGADDTCQVQVRERYNTDGWRGTAAARLTIVGTALIVKNWLRRSQKSLAGTGNIPA